MLVFLKNFLGGKCEAVYFGFLVSGWIVGRDYE
jgi:hypothetical protein